MVHRERANRDFDQQRSAGNDPWVCDQWPSFGTDPIFQGLGHGPRGQLVPAFPGRNRLCDGYLRAGIGHRPESLERRGERNRDLVLDIPGRQQLLRQFNQRDVPRSILHSFLRQPARELGRRFRANASGDHECRPGLNGHRPDQRTDRWENLLFPRLDAGRTRFGGRYFQRGHDISPRGTDTNQPDRKLVRPKYLGRWHHSFGWRPGGNPRWPRRHAGHERHRGQRFIRQRIRHLRHPDLGDAVLQLYPDREGNGLCSRRRRAPHGNGGLADPRGSQRDAHSGFHQHRKRLRTLRQ